LLLALLLAVGSVAAPTAQPVPLDSLARAVAEAEGLPSLVVGVSVGGERWVVGVGDADSTRAAPDAHTLYEIGSISKVLTSLALADAVARGETTLATPVADLLPDSFAVGAHAAGPIRLVDLATHTSGLPRLDLGMGMSPGFDLANPYAAYGVARLATFLATVTPATAPGATYLYSNAGAGLLGYALAQRAGTPYADLVADRVLEPLGMGETWVDVPDAHAARFVDGHGPDGAPVPHWTWTAPTVGAGGWRSSASDLLTLAEATMDPDATPLAAALALTLTPHAPIEGVRQMGLGWHLFPLSDGRTMAAHDGGTGGFVSFLAVVPAAGVAVVVLTNRQASVDAFAVDLVRRLAAAAD